MGIVGKGASMSDLRDLTIGLDCGTGGARALIADPKGTVLAMATRDYPTTHPHPGWATQLPADWWRAACGAVREAMSRAAVPPSRIAAICADGTSSTLVALDDGLAPIGEAILWMDNRASPQARTIEASGHPALRRSRAGVSAETALPKILWLRDNDPARFAAARWFVEMADYLALRLSGQLTLGQNLTTNRWFFDPRHGWPEDFLAAIGLEGITARFPAAMPAIGSVIGTLTREAAGDLGLDPATLVVAGGTDAYVAMVGLNTLRPGETALITGTSHLVLPVVAEDAEVEGLFGPHPDCVVKGAFVMEGGQVSSGALLRWWHDMLHESGPGAYDAMLTGAEAVPAGANGLVVLDFWQGNRNPYTDYDLQGAIWGLTLKHGPAHVTRALMESVALGTANILSRLTEAGVPVLSMTLAGGVLRSRFWAQMHADATGTRLLIPEVAEATAFGAAIAAAVGADLHPSLQEGAAAMVRIRDEILPDAAAHERFRDQLDLYLQTHAAMRPLMHRMAAINRAAAAAAG